MKYFTLLFLCCFLSFKPLSAQLLWEISGNGLEEKSYLFGTVHVGDEEVIDFASRAFPYLDSSCVIAGELKLDFISSFTAIMHVMSPKDSVLSKLLPQHKYEQIKPYLVEKIGQNSRFIDLIRPVFIMAMLQEKGQSIPMNMEQASSDETYPPLDLYLQNRAKEKGKEVIGLETIKEQMNAINTNSLPDQANALYEYVVEEQKALLDSTLRVKSQSDTLVQANLTADRVVELYLSENIDHLHDMISKEFSPALYHALIVLRNKRMVGRIVKKLEQKKLENSMFIAVGAGHLGGDEGMVKLLKETGYTLKPIFLNKKGN